MAAFLRSRPRSCWVTVVNCVVICLLLMVLTAGPNDTNVVVIGVLAVGIILEWRGSAGSALFNVVPFLWPFALWAWEATRDTHFREYQGEYETSLILFAAPSLAIAAVNLFFYVPALRRWWRDRKAPVPVADWMRPIADNGALDATVIRTRSSPPDPPGLD